MRLPTLEPDGQLSRWLQVDKALLEAAGAHFGDIAAFEILPVEEEPEPEIPPDLREALAASPEARAVWDDTTTIARLDWIHWVTSAKQAKTRAKPLQRTQGGRLTAGNAACVVTHRSSSR